MIPLSINMAITVIFSDFNRLHNISYYCINYKYSKAMFYCFLFIPYLTSEYVSRIEKKAIDKLRERL